jgi:hypothetical protein
MKTTEEAMVALIEGICLESELHRHPPWKHVRDP